MSLKPEERVKRWVSKKPIGHTFTSSDVSKETGIPSRFVASLLAEITEKEGTERTVKHTNPDEKKAVFVWERI